MKKKISSILILLLMLSLLLSGCSGGNADGGEQGGEGGEGGGTADTSDYVYGGDIIPLLVIDENADKITVNAIYAALKESIGTNPDYVYTDDVDLPEEGEHEIVIGNTDREISKRAMRELSRIERNNEYYAAYLIYARGNSIAVVYDEDVDALAKDKAAEALIEQCFKGKTELKLTSGVVLSDCFDTLSIYAETDEQYYVEAWEKLRAAVGEEHGDEFVAAMQEMYGIYSHDMATWLANLYDPGVGGFYYSNSARDNGSYAPDTESTCQALGLVTKLGQIRAWRTGKSAKYSVTLSEKRKNEIIVYIKSLQDENGFFYNYQWEKTASDMHSSRISRDLNWCTSILSVLGARPTYNTPTGQKGDGVVVKGTYDPTILMQAPDSLGGSVVTAVSKVVLAASYAPQFENQETLKKYLYDFEMSSTGFYSIGNTMTSQMAQIIARDKTLREEFYADKANEGKTYESLVTIVMNWFNKHQDPRNGLWGHNAEATANYHGVNGLLKISGVYNKAGYEIPYAELAAKSAIDAISSDEGVGAVVDIYNAWFALGNVLDNMRDHGKTVTEGGVTKTGKDRADEIMMNMRKLAAPAIKETAEKVALFAKDDGSFSYTITASSSTSQGMPVAVPGTNEGDVNATVIATDVTGYIYSALGLPGVAIYTETDLRIFLGIFENLDPVLKKNPIKKLDDGPLTFDEDEVGSDFCDLNVNMASGTVTVEKDTREGHEGNTVRVTGAAGAGGYIYSRNNAENKDANCAIFETDMRVNEGTTEAYIFQITIGSSYMFDVVVEEGEVLIREATTTSWSSSRYTNAGKVAVGEWFHLRVEFYKYGYKGEQRACIYINGELKIVTDGFFGLKKNSLGEFSGKPNRGAVSSTSIYKMNGANINISFDNTYTTTVNTEYKVPNDPEGKLVYNVDKDVLPEEG